MKNKIKYFMMLALFILCIQTVSALRNPAADYCTAMEYEYTTRMTPDGEEGLCKLPNGQTVEAWKFLLGEAAQEFNYCTKQGYEQRITQDSTKCEWFLTDTCTVCVVDGKEVEVTDLMGLNFRETSCGDGSCGFPEDAETCPQDCGAQLVPRETSPAKEVVYVVQKEGISNNVLIVIGVVLLAIVILIFWFLRKKK